MSTQMDRKAKLLTATSHLVAEVFSLEASIQDAHTINPCWIEGIHGEVHGMINELRTMSSMLNILKVAPATSASNDKQDKAWAVINAQITRLVDAKHANRSQSGKNARVVDDHLERAVDALIDLLDEFSGV